MIPSTPSPQFQPESEPSVTVLAEAAGETDSIGLEVRQEPTLELREAEWPIVAVGDVPFAVVSLEGASQRLIRRDQNPGQPFRLTNAGGVALADKDLQYRDLVCEEGVNLPDGKSVTVALKLVRRRAAEPFQGHIPLQVRGPALFNETLRASQSTGTRHYFLGGAPTTLERLTATIRTRYPSIVIAGSLSPPYEPLSIQAMESWAELIKKADAELVWVGLGAPKQDYAVSQLARMTGLNCVAVGAAFDFLAGTQREAPLWMQQSGTEWLFRLLMEPRRLWKRYLVYNMRFLLIVARQLTGRRSDLH